MSSPYDNLRFSQSQIIPQYAGAPVEEFGKLLEKREADYQANSGALDQLELVAADLDINAADYTVKKQAIDDIKSGIQGIVDSGGAYEFAGTQVRQLAKNFTTNQGLKAAVENQTNITARKKELQALYLSNKISSVGYEYAVDKLDAYEGVGEGKDSVYNKPEMYNPVKFTDVGDKLNKFGNGWKADSESKGWVLRPNGYYYKNTETKVDPNEIREAMRDFANGDPDIMATVSEYEEITGEDMLTPLIEAQADKLGFSITDQDMKADTVGMAARKAAADVEYNAGKTYPTLINTKGHKFESSADQKEELATIEDQRQGMIFRVQTLLKEGADENKVQIAALKQSLKALDETERQAKNYDSSLLLQATTNLIELGELPEDFDLDSYAPSEKDILDSKSDAGTAFDAENPGQFTLNYGEKRDKYIEKNYSKYLIQRDPLLAEKERLYEEGAEDNVIRANVTYPGDGPERKENTAWIQAATGIGLGKEGTELGDNSADALAYGFQWFDNSHGANENVGADVLKGATGIQYVGTAFDEASGTYRYIYNIQSTEGGGQISLGADVIENDIIRSGEGSGLTAFTGSQISRIDNDSLNGEGEITIKIDDKGKSLETVKVKSYYKSPTALQKEKGHLYEIYTVDENEVEYIITAIDRADLRKKLAELIALKQD